MNMRVANVLAAAAVTAAVPVLAQTEFSWRYYRPGNTGMQGDFCEAIWIGADSDPWIGGYVPGFEEGGVSKFLRGENRWINVSNVDHPEIGHPDNTGTSRVSEIVADAAGTLWMGTGRGALKFDPAVGPSSLVRYDVNNSTLSGGWVENVELAPDGTLWFSAYGTAWGGGGVSRYTPADNTWRTWESIGGALAAQPKPGGGYYVWAQNARFDSTTQAWTTFPIQPGEVAGPEGADATDESGNTWLRRYTDEFGRTELGCRSTDGAWLSFPPPPIPFGNPSIWAFRAFGDRQVLLIDDAGHVWRFNGAAWDDLGAWRQGAFSSDVMLAPNGDVWACGTGGAARRDAATGVWQRYRLTNSGQLEYFVNDLALDDATGRVWATANGAPGVGGIEMFDGVRWTGFNNDTYGLGHPWPFPTDNADAIFVRPSNGDVVANPMFGGTSVYDGTGWRGLPGGSGEVIAYVEDSLGRLWQLGEYYSLSYWTGAAWNNVEIAAWGQKIQVDPDRAGTVWAQAGYEIVRTDGAYRFSRTIDDFPELTSQSDTFSGLAVAGDGVCWVGCSVMLGAGGSGGGLIRLDAATGRYTMIKYEDGWPFPGQFVSPLAVTPDGRLWMQYDSDFLTAQRGLCWWDGTNVGVFPAPAGGEPQWGGLPHAAIEDCEVRLIPGGYELWMSCMSRGIAVLSVTGPGCAADFNGDGQADFFDYLDFVQAFDAEAEAADFNGDGQIDFFDYLDFVRAFDAGCG